MENKEYIFPEIEFQGKIIPTHEEEDYYFLTLRTTIRKKHSDGKYYLVPLGMQAQNESLESGVADDVFVSKCYQKFITSVYRTIILGKIQPNNEFFDYELDTNQSDEESRLKDL